MKRVAHQKIVYLLVGVAALAALAGLGCCNGGNNGPVGPNQPEQPPVIGTETTAISIDAAKNWIVIHDKNKMMSEGGQWAGCEPFAEKDRVAFLPTCLSIKSGEKIGFANYSDVDVVIKHFDTLNAPNPITLASGETKIFDVEVDQITPMIYQIESTENGITTDHGGPEMIIEP